MDSQYREEYPSVLEAEREGGLEIDKGCALKVGGDILKSLNLL